LAKADTALQGASVGQPTEPCLGYLFDDCSGRAILDFGGIHAGLDEIGYRTGTA
jgi:hypothetical protein